MTPTRCSSFAQHVDTSASLDLWFHGICMGVDAIPTHLMFSNHDCAHLHSLVLYKLQRLHTIHTAHCVHLKWLILNSTLLRYVQLDSKFCEQIGRIQNTLQQSPFPPSLTLTHSHHKQIVCLWCKWVNIRFGWKSDYCYVFWILNQSVHRLTVHPCDMFTHLKLSKWLVEMTISFLRWAAHAYMHGECVQCNSLTKMP